VPDPDPEKHRDEDDEGSKPAGQPPLGNDTHKPPEPAAATAWTHAVDRRANADLPSPNCPEATEKTCALGHASRTTASTPVAQPTTTFAELGTATIAENNAVEATASSGRREPEKPTTEAEAKKEESMVAIKLRITIFTLFTKKAVTRFAQAEQLEADLHSVAAELDATMWTHCR